MLVFRCTQKLLKRLKVRGPFDLPHSSTALGDWYGNTLNVGRLRLVMFISEPTMLPVVVMQRESSTLVPRFQKALCEVLEGLQIPAPIVTREIDVDGGFVFGPTASRQVVGVLTELAFHAEGELRSGECGSLLQLSLRLSDIPLTPLEHVVPAEAVRMRIVPGAPQRAIW